MFMRQRHFWACASIVGRHRCREIVSGKRLAFGGKCEWRIRLETAVEDVQIYRYFVLTVYVMPRFCDLGLKPVHYSIFLEAPAASSGLWTPVENFLAPPSVLRAIFPAHCHCLYTWSLLKDNIPYPKHLREFRIGTVVPSKYKHLHLTSTLLIHIRHE